MDDGVFFPPNTMSGTPPDSFMDLDYMDELLLDGCWLETTDGSDFLLHSTSNSGALFDPSFTWPTLQTNNDTLSGSHHKRTVKKIGKGSEVSRRWWIGPRANHFPALSVTERLIQALGYIKNCTRDENILIQIWIPVNKGGRCVLTTSDQPFSLDRNCPRLSSYRDISVSYQFATEEDSKESMGLPGRAFMCKVPEWTPDVRFFRREEFPRVGHHAKQYDVRGTIAVPVFEQGSQSCLGVIEVVMTTQKINYRPELESVCQALKAVDLRGSEVSSAQNVKACDGSYQAVLPEILEVLRSACGTHRLPLAQTWVPCVQQAKEGCRHSDENFVHCVSTVDSAYIADPSIQGFHEACSEHHLLKGQGVVGRAFTTNQPSFSPDVTSYSKTEYPLSHHARMFGLRAAVAIRLRSIYTGTTDFVLEFFLPVDCVDPEEQKAMLNSLSIIIQKVCWSLRVITNKELQENTFLPVGALKFPSYVKLGREMPEVECTQSARHFHEVSSCIGRKTEAKEGDNLPLVQEPRQQLREKALDFMKQQHDSDSRATLTNAEDNSTSGEDSFLNVGNTGEKRVKRHTKAEKSITLQMLRHYFAGSLKDAAKSIGVCPTTLKRICRQHGIKRWPSRKIKKVGHSLQKIQLVMDSVQGASGAFHIDSFYSNFPELASTNLTGISPFSALITDDDSKSFNRKLEGVNLKPQAAASKSLSPSCSQSSCSSQSCSSGTQPHPQASHVAGHEDPIVRENSSDSVLERAGSDAELHMSSDEVPKLLPRSHSHKSLSDHPKSECPLPIAKNTGGNSQRGIQRFKVTYGEEKIRFRMQNNWGYKDLLQEIARRFRIGDTKVFQLKYLDDDSEWVLLTCDDDLEECIDVCQSLRSQIIKLALCSDSQKNLRSYMGSSSPL
ncbi:unnamed protein product [Ilex paraguariensis]|uniref:Uncharacterized protein n=1 Tax=Ilex paraguariensis TaxID=185542 RepID=A0ABC8TBZ2_9AQUA